MTTVILNTNIGEAENKISYTSSFMATAVLNTKLGEAENKISYVSGSVKKTDYDAKISGTGKIYWTNSEWHTWCKGKKRNLFNKLNISNLKKNSTLDTELATLVTKAGLKAEQG